MNRSKRSAVSVATAALVAATIPATVPLTAHADSAPITVTLSVTPATMTVGGQVTLVATLTNNTSSTTSGALGIENPDWSNQHITYVSPGCRNVIRTIYCGDPQLAAGASMVLTVKLTATGTGTDSFTAYGRITNVNDQYAYGTLTIS
jgi:hypothetical protein